MEQPATRPAGPAAGAGGGPEARRGAGRGGRKLHCRLFALLLRGDSDTATTVDDADEWRSVTTGSFRIKAFPDGHFYQTKHASAVNDEIAADIDRIRNEILAADPSK